MCEHFHESAKGALAKGAEKLHNFTKGRLPGITPNMIIGSVNKSAPPPVTSSEHSYPRPPLAKDNLSVLDQLECPVCLDILTQPMELPCKAMACAQCIIHWVGTTGSVHCPCCYSCEPMHIKPASNLVLLMLKDVLVHCTICIRDMRLLCMSIMSAPHHLHMRSNDQLLNSSKGSVLKKVYFNFLYRGNS